MIIAAAWTLILVIVLIGAGFITQLLEIIELLADLVKAVERLDCPLSDLVEILDKEPLVKLSDQAIIKIKEYASRDSYASIAPENKEVYQAGLQDGVTAFSKFLKEELTEETDA